MADNASSENRDGSIWYNGTLVPWRDANLHVLSHGLHYASCVFEGARVYNGKAFKLEEHLERLHYSAKELDFEIPYSVETLKAACEEVIQAEKIDDGYIRPFAWKGADGMGISSRNHKINVAVATWPWPPYYSDDIATKGIKLTLADYKRPSPECAPVHSKAAGLYMICMISKQAAENKGFHEALMLDYRGYVAEATSANFFMVVNGELHTPIADCFLNGITRRTVMVLAEERGITVVEKHFGLEALADAQEAFLTGSAAEITPIGQIDDYQFEVGPITKQLMEAYQTLVRS